MNRKYQHQHFRERAYHATEKRQQLLRDVGTAVRCGQDVFITPLLRDAPSRKIDRSRPLPGRYIWLDVDDWTPELEQALKELGLPCLLVDSGGLGVRRHAYLDVGPELPGEQLADYADRLAKLLGTDAAGGNNKYLGCPAR